MSKKLATIPELQHAFMYNPVTGRVHNRLTFPIEAMGSIADVSIERGYRQLRFNGRLYYAHRLAFVLQSGQWPVYDVDHVNGNTLDNTWTNLRDVPKSTNQQNRKGASLRSQTGLLGVEVHADGGFTARIMANRQRVYLGYFSTAEAAHEAYLEAKRKLHQGNTL